MPKVVFRTQGKFNFIDEFKLFDEYPDNIFHYTNLNALVSIVKKKELWLTQYKYLNDTSEIEYAENILLNEAKKIKNKNIRIKIENLISSIKKNLENTFILSLSKNSDSLPLWSYYSALDGFNAPADSFGHLVGNIRTVCK